MTHSTPNHRLSNRLPFILACMGGVFLIIAALAWRLNQQKADAFQPSTHQHQTHHQAFTLEQLASFDGKVGHECYVAVEGTVYKIIQDKLWQDGNHLTSKGQATCGQDLSHIIGKSPHGKSKLQTLEVVGMVAGNVATKTHGR